MKRFESLDWLRGIMAFAIMIYHLVGWNLVQPEAGSVLGNFGIYGVSIFFVLSGLSMGIVYHNYIKGFQTSIVFFIRRLFRLLPLLWIAVAVVSGVVYLLHGDFNFYKIFLNITLLFGFVAPDQYINVGAWSIGNEACYYALTPFFIMFYARSKALGNAAVLGTVAIGLYYAFYLLDPSKTLTEQWQTYINPLSNMYLYTLGLSLYYNFHDVKLKRASYLLIIISFAVLCLCPVSGDQIVLVTGINDVIFSLASVAITLGFYKLEVTLPEWITKPFANLGEATYGVYLLHPVIYIFTNKLIANPYLCIATTVCITIVAANISYQFYEKRFIKIGKKLTSGDSKVIRPAV
ncbi:TPA: acyltransferase [Acinetobacter baumannii]|nr:acyltransferase [Acinetobacter baumannii]HAV5727221.1 acyltransferase [Acinetobacter baumannii]HAV5730814.1 acyltransferase [Acinetobacter baumannii]